MSWILLLSTRAIITYHRIISQPFRFTTDLKVNEISLQIDTFLSKTIIFSAHRVTKSIYFFKNNITNELQMIDIVVMKINGSLLLLEKIFLLQVHPNVQVVLLGHIQASLVWKCSPWTLVTVNQWCEFPSIEMQFRQSGYLHMLSSGILVLNKPIMLIAFLVLNSTGLSSPIGIVCPAGTYSIVLGN